MSIYQILRDFGTELFEGSLPPNNNIDNSAHNPTSNTPTASPSAARAAPAQSNVEAAVSPSRNMTSVDHPTNSMITELGGALDATSAQPSAALALDVQSDDRFYETPPAGRSRSPDQQDPATLPHTAPQQIPTPSRARRPRQSYALTEYNRHLATLLALAEDAPHTPSASNHFRPPNPFIDRFAAIGSLMNAYGHLSDRDIGMENTTLGQERGRLQQIVDLQWQVVENGLTDAIMDLDQLMRGGNRDSDSDLGSDNRPDYGESSGAQPSRERGGRGYTHGGQGEGGGDRGGRGRGSRDGWNGNRGRSGAPSPDNSHIGTSRRLGEQQRDRSTEPAPLEDASCLNSPNGDGRGPDDLEMAFITSGPVEPATLNAPVVQSIEEIVEDVNRGGEDDNEDNEGGNESKEDNEGDSGAEADRDNESNENGDHSSIAATAVDSWDDACNDPRDDGRVERSMLQE